MPQVEEVKFSRVKRPRQEAGRYYDRLSGIYDALAASSEDRFIARGVDMLNLRPGERAVEIGFGTGRGLVRLAERVGPDGQVLGVDLSEGMADQARKRLDRAGLSERVELIIEDAVNLPLEDDLVDAVLISFTLELFSREDLERVLEEAWRILRENGRLAVIALNKDENFTPAGRLYEKLHELFPRFLDCRPIPVVPILRREGWMIDRQETYSMWGLPVSVSLARKAVNRTGK
jgi:demethylmenaquinone methyltransferase/2-methoxy-6-polyprenyl-1,4-benzoquinol methylase